MLIGIVGAPNKGKSTIFSAMTLNEVAIADYPFTTINPNLGVAYATKKCVDSELNVKCNARNSTCVDGIRHIPVNLIDVAGLVEGAHLGKGMGNQFLNDLASADALIVVVDASGKTDPGGNHCLGCDPSGDISMVTSEITEWLCAIIKKHEGAVSKSHDAIDALSGVLTGLGVTKAQISTALDASFLPSSIRSWSDADVMKFARELLKGSKPMIVAANKSDTKEADANIAKLRSEFGDAGVVDCSGAMELALRRAAKQGVIDYAPGSRDFKLLKEGLPQAQSAALDYMRGFLKRKGTNIQELLNRAVFDTAKNIVVYPVEDERKYSDHGGYVLPDALIVRQGTTAMELAGKIHTDLAKNMLYAIDARTKRRLDREYVLQDNDVIRIVSAAK
jgi:hypothetical protein